MDKSAAAPSAKAALRSEAHRRRDGLAPEARAAASAVIAERAIAVAARVRPACIAAYLPIRSECDPRAVIDWAVENGIATALPAVIDSATIVFRSYRPGDLLAANSFGTLAPTAGAQLADPDLIVAPVIAFDRTGARLGHGLGFYDRAVAALRARGVKPLLVGVAFSVQEVTDIPVEPHDHRLDWVVTEKETLDLRRAR
jgi:5-formyltetrahydrofolate cyclo-ligase